MNILIVNNTCIPTPKYGGTERVIWSLGKELVEHKHRPAYLVKKPSYCNFAPIFFYNEHASLQEQLWKIKKEFNFDLVHFFFNFSEEIEYPYLATIGGNGQTGEIYPHNTVFVSRNHAERHGSQHYVYNGLNWEDYPSPNFSFSRKGFAFLSDIKRPEKNLSDCLEIIQQTEQTLTVMGGWKLSLNRKIKYLGMVDNQVKGKYLEQTKAMLFPIRWHEPFGLAVIEAMYYGCPVFATPYGAMPELITPESGLLLNTKSDFINAITNLDDFKFEPYKISGYVAQKFSSKTLLQNYFQYYEKIIDGVILNSIRPVAQKNSDRNNLLPLIDIK